jgi:hypothetical protein
MRRGGHLLFLKKMVYRCMSHEIPFPPYTRPHAIPIPRSIPTGAVTAISARVMIRPLAKAGTMILKINVA